MSYAYDQAETAYAMECEIESDRRTRENEWRAGIHKDQFGKEYKIKDMTTPHIKNTISFFGVEDYKNKLYVELSKREPLFIND